MDTSYLLKIIYHPDITMTSNGISTCLDILSIFPQNLTETCSRDIQTCQNHSGECPICSIRDCPFTESLHYHHDGCPACFFATRKEILNFMKEKYTIYYGDSVEVALEKYF